MFSASVYLKFNLSCESPTILSQSFVMIDNKPAWLNFDEGRIIMNRNIVFFTETHLKDHLGNTRVAFGLTNNALVVKQVNSYYPFGMNIKGLTSGIAFGSSKFPKNEYLYNGKMFQDELGLDWLDYGARMSDAKLGRFYTIDPLAERFNHQSLYVYADNNPIRFVDFLGMNATGYSIDKDGNIEHLNDEGGDNYDVIYKNENYSETDRKNYDESGSKKGIKVSKGVVESEKTAKHPIVDIEGNPTGKIIYNHRYEVKTDKEALNIMLFFDKNTNVEWSNTNMKNSGGEEINLLMTSHQSGEITMGHHQTDKYVNKGFKIQRHDHIHPSGNPSPSKWYGDWFRGKVILEKSPNAKFRILANGKYYLYTIPKQ